MNKKLTKREKKLIELTEENPRNKQEILQNMQASIKIFEYIDKELFKDITFVEQVISINGLALQYMPERIKNNKELVLKAINTSAGFALKYASKELQADRDVVKESIKRWRSPLKYASIELQKEFNKNINDYYQKHKIVRGDD